jgi:hypothetical protein
MHTVGSPATGALMRIVRLSLVVAALLFAAGCTDAEPRELAPPLPAPTPTSSEAHGSSALRDLFEAEDPVVQSRTCDEPRIILATPDGTQTFAPAGGPESRNLLLRTGATLRVRATGNCAHTVQVSAGNSRLVARRGTGPGRYVFDARRAGSVVLTASTSMCARPRGFESSECRGGSDRLLVVEVDVLA